jgi:multiple sugar transport system substrate-binding protein
MFVSGKVAMNVTGHWLVPKYREIDSFRWDVAAVPTGKGGKAVLNFGSCYSIMAGTKHPEEAWRLLKYYSSAEVGRKLAEFGYFTPANKEVAYSDEFLNNPLPPKNEIKFLEAVDYAHPFPFSTKTAQIIERITSGLDVVFNGEKKATEVCPRLAEEITRILQEEEL